MACLATWIDAQLLQVIHDGSDAGLGFIGAFAVRAAAILSRAETAAAVAILRIPVVGALGRVRILDFIYDTGVGSTSTHGDFMRRERLRGPCRR